MKEFAPLDVSKYDHPVKHPDCCACKKVIPIDEDEQAYFVHIRRGWFPMDVEKGGIEEEFREEEVHIKADMYICEECYLNDPDLCAFFNRIGRRIR